MPQETKNLQFDLAADVVNYTAQNLFLTGKAGTGKTTFLKFIREHTQKNSVVVAPTGVAAINAGGVTMHSFFQLPLIPYLPGDQFFNGTSNVHNRFSLIKSLRLGGNKIDLMNEMELLIIDEVSMMRADMLDAADMILRHAREKKNIPFGGVQVLFIGDLFQLPPVVADDEWSVLKTQYESPFFFSARVLQQHPPLKIELKHIYRQSQNDFIELLNQIRNNELTESSINYLHQRFIPNRDELPSGIITLTTHNHIADKINREELLKLDSPIHRFDGVVTGNFNDKSMPTEMELSLREGAQIMFIKNDLSPEKRYFNGKLASVKSISKDEIKVLPEGSDVEIILEKEKWRNIQYRLNRESGKIEEEELGSFTQYPVRLAWAITIHKSQGLTFDSVIIDAGQSFAAGQVYVALSRCRTFDGLYLSSRISNNNVISDEKIVQFSKLENSTDEILERLKDEKLRYNLDRLTHAFNFKKVIAAIHEFKTIANIRKASSGLLATELAEEMQKCCLEHQEISGKFVSELHARCSTSIDEEWMKLKVPAAKKYFSKRIHEELIQPVNLIQQNVQGKSRLKQFTKHVNMLHEVLWRKIREIENAGFIGIDLGIEPMQRIVEPVKKERHKKVAGESRNETIALYKKGLTIEEIAAQRNLVVSTIEGHLAHGIKLGEVNIYDFVDEESIQKIKAFNSKNATLSLVEIQIQTGVKIGYGRIRMVLAYLSIAVVSSKLSA